MDSSVTLEEEFLACLLATGVTVVEVTMDECPVCEWAQKRKEAGGMGYFCTRYRRWLSGQLEGVDEYG